MATVPRLAEHVHDIAGTAVGSAGSAQWARDRPGVLCGFRRGHSAPVARARPGTYRGITGRNPAHGRI